AATVEAIEDLRADLAGLPSPEELPHLLAARRAADERLEAAKAAAADRQAAVDELRRSRQELEEQEKEAWERFASLRDRLAVLEPPPAPRHDLAAAWEGLVTWAEAKRREVAEQLLEAKAAAEDAAEAVELDPLPLAWPRRWPPPRPSSPRSKRSSNSAGTWSRPSPGAGKKRPSPPSSPST